VALKKGRTMKMSMRMMRTDQAMRASLRTSMIRMKKSSLMKRRRVKQSLQRKGRIDESENCSQPHSCTYLIGEKRDMRWTLFQVGLLQTKITFGSMMAVLRRKTPREPKLPPELQT
jgi:hypothetical protein